MYDLFGPSWLQRFGITLWRIQVLVVESRSFDQAAIQTSAVNSDMLASFVP